MARQEAVKSELDWVVKFPIRCPHCGKESMEVAARLINDRSAVCSNAGCGASIDLSSKEWKPFIDEISEALQKLRPLYEKAP